MKLTSKLPAIFFFCFFLTAFQFNSTAQKAESNTIDVKLYSNYNYAFSIVEDRYDIGYFSPAAVLKQENGNFHEIELSRLRFDNQRPSNNYDERQEFFIAARYEYNIKLLKNREAPRFEYFIGLSANPFFRRIRAEIDNRNSNTNFYYSYSEYTYKGNHLGVSFSVVPRINFNLSEQWYLDLNVPFSIVDFSWGASKIEITDEPDKVSGLEYYDSYFIPRELLLRIGVGLRL